MDNQEAVKMMLEILNIKDDGTPADEIIAGLNLQAFLQIAEQSCTKDRELGRKNSFIYAEFELWCFKTGGNKASTLQEWVAVYRWAGEIESHLLKWHCYSLPPDKLANVNLIQENALKKILTRSNSYTICERVARDVRRGGELEKTLKKRMFLIKNNLCELCEQTVTPDNDARIFHLILSKLPIDSIEKIEQIEQLPDYKDFMELVPRHIIPAATGNFWAGVICPGSPTRQNLISTDEEWKKAYQKQQELFK